MPGYSSLPGCMRTNYVVFRARAFKAPALCHKRTGHGHCKATHPQKHVVWTKHIGRTHCRSKQQTKSLFPERFQYNRCLLFCSNFYWQLEWINLRVYLISGHVNVIWFSGYYLESQIISKWTKLTNQSIPTVVKYGKRLPLDLGPFGNNFFQMKSTLLEKKVLKS